MRVEYKIHGAKAALYFIKGHIRWWIHGPAIRQWYKKTKECKPCFDEGSCTHCGCAFNQLSLSGKPCEKSLI